jgi:hypothetical protein
MMKFRKSLLLLTACASALLVTSCGDNVVEAERNETSARLNVVVRDAVTGLPIPNDVGVTVELLAETGGAPINTGKSATTTVTFDNVKVGKYRVKVTPDDTSKYIGVIAPAEITLKDVTGYTSTTIGEEATIHVSIYERNATLSGHIQYKDRDGILREAANAPVRVQLTNQNFVLRVFNTMTGPDGKYVFDNLPAVGTDYEVWALDTTFNGIAYRATEIGVNDGKSIVPSLVANHLARMPAEGLYTQDNTQFGFLVSYETVAIQPNANIVFTFSDDVNVALVDEKTVSIVGTNLPPYDIVWSGNTLTIKPYGVWRGSVEVKINSIRSMSGAPFTTFGPYTIAVEIPDLSNQVVTNVKVLTPKDSINRFTAGTEPDNSVYGGIEPNIIQLHIGWDTIAGAERYEVFAKNEGSTNNYRLVGTFETSVVPTTAQMSNMVDVNKNGIYDSTFTFVVQAINSRSRSKLETITPDTAKSNLVIVSASGANQRAGTAPAPLNTTNEYFIFGALSSQKMFQDSLEHALTTGDSLRLSAVFSFSEPVIGATSTVEYKYGAGAAERKITVTPTWNGTGANRTILTLVLTVTTGTPYTTKINEELFFENLKGANNKPLKFGYVSAGNRVYVEKIGFNIKTND